MIHARTAVLVCVVVLASCSSAPRKEVEPKPAPVAPPPSKGITFAAVGDIMMGTDYPTTILPDDDGVGFLANVAPVLSAADVAFGNLEGVLMDGGEAVKRCKPPPKKKKEPAKAPVSPAPQAEPSVPEESASGAPANTGAAPAVPPAKNAAGGGSPTPEQPPAAGSGASVDSAAADADGAAPAAPPAVAPAPSAAAAATTTEGTPPAAPPAKDAAGGEGQTREQTPAAASGASPTSAASTAAGAEPVSPAKDAAAGDSKTREQTPAAASGAQADSSASMPPAGNASSQGQQSSSAPQPATAGSCYVFRSPTRYATYLRDAGFDVMSLANNHAQDFGDAGRDSSMRALDDVGIRHSGREGDVAEWTTHGRRFALVAFAPNIGSHQLNELERARAIVADLAARHDIVVVSFHGGSEGEGASTLPFAHELYQGEDRGDVVEFAHAVVDAGADLVLGSGPHVLRAIELYRDRLIAYSLGNFATYYGISVTGIRGLAGILTTRLGDDGRFLDARLDSTIQLRPAGPSLDPERRAVTRLRELTGAAFPQGHLTIEDDGRIVPR